MILYFENIGAISFTPFQKTLFQIKLLICLFCDDLLDFPREDIYQILKSDKEVFCMYTLNSLQLKYPGRKMFLSKKSSSFASMNNLMLKYLVINSLIQNSIALNCL